MSAEAIEGAIAAAVEFLLRSREPSGLWSDFSTRAGPSVDWVSGHVVSSLCGIPKTAIARQSAASALLARQRSSGGWGYHERIPEDADSTAHVIRSIIGAARLAPHARRSAIRFLQAHQLPSGGFTTYRRLEAIGSVIGEPRREALAGWGSAHTCVTANSVIALLELGMRPSAPTITRALDHLERAAERSGLWMSYWWRGSTYGTYHALLALTIAGRAGHQMRARVARALAAVRHDDGGWGDTPEPGNGSHAFATALGLRAVALAAPDRSFQNAVDEAAAWLLDKQLPDGSWSTVPILRIPDADVVNPRHTKKGPSRPGTGIAVADQARVYTTASTVQAFHMYRRSWAIRSGQKWY